MTPWEAKIDITEHGLGPTIKQRCGIAGVQKHLQQWMSICNPLTQTRELIATSLSQDVLLHLLESLLGIWLSSQSQYKITGSGTPTSFRGAKMIHTGNREYAKLQERSSQPNGDSLKSLTRIDINDKAQAIDQKTIWKIADGPLPPMQEGIA
ncbi:hypothetical protein K435DRAFT_803486 [Dendrothele bispora CBS 962.96]|uniref:Uncharacterized protein n=1 Tax=Dendrothele bispora (strain CBS 962.96) TaxID=1314807 RepID=A0A4S8LHG9_DENBC|nr:hypothetical protein K435DRAFT_803486 [Dendrothele bispora CBS 962.96]